LPETSQILEAMKTELIQTLTTTFEAHAQKVEGGVEYWLARDLQYLLGYSKWDNFVGVVSKAKTACELSGHKVSDHFADVGKTIQMPKGATKEGPVIMVPRFACLASKEKKSLKNPDGLSEPTEE
jgi:DNA-damage-inducible protein D